MCMWYLGIKVTQRYYVVIAHRVQANRIAKEMYPVNARTKWWPYTADWSIGVMTQHHFLLNGRATLASPTWDLDPLHFWHLVVITRDLLKLVHLRTYPHSPIGTDNEWWPRKHIRLVSRRYASYWNTVLFSDCNVTFMLDSGQRKTANNGVFTLPDTETN